MARGDRDDRIMRRGARLLWRSVRAQPGPFSLAVAGATLFAVMAVGGTIVLGKVTDEVLTPAFEEGGVERRAVAIGAAAIIGASLLRMVGVVLPALLRADGPAPHAGALVRAGDRPLPLRAPPVVRRPSPPASSSPTPTPTASARRWRCSRCRSRWAWW